MAVSLLFGLLIGNAFDGSTIARTQRPQLRPVCTGTFDGLWMNATGGVLLVSPQANFVAGTFSFTAGSQTTFQGKIDNNVLRAQWTEASGKSKGDLFAEYFPIERRVHLVSSYLNPNQQKEVREGDFYCQSVKPGQLPTQTPPPPQLPSISPSPDKDPPTSNVTTPEPCTGSFAGDWTPQGYPYILHITVSGDSAEGDYFEERSQRKLKGKINGNTFAGDWAEVGQLQGSGTFVFTLLPAEHRIKLVFYINKNFEHSEEWTCAPARAVASFPVLPRGKLDASYDTDNFHSFDALPKREQEKLLVKNGPRLPLEYDASDLALRVFVRGGWPVVLDYGMEEEAVGEISIFVPGIDPVFATISPAKRAQLRIAIPDYFGPTSQVAQVRIVTNTKSTREPADFRLYGIAMGDKAVALLRDLTRVGAPDQLALNHFGANNDGGERSPLFAPAPLQAGSTIQLDVRPPTTIRPGDRPKKLIQFSATSTSDFSNGRWEIRQVRGRRWLKVWEEKTGTILPRRTKSNHWDGIISIRRIVSLGNHALKITAWHGAEDSRYWVVAQTDPNLTVIE
jgi:hypothetical protein